MKICNALFVFVVVNGMFAVCSASESPAIIFNHENASNLWLSRDGKTLVSESNVWWQREIIVWDLASSEKVETINATKVRAFSNDGHYIIYGAEACYLHKIGSDIEDVTLQENSHFDPIVAAIFCGARIILLHSASIETRDLTGKVLKRIALCVVQAGKPDVVGALAPNGYAAALWNTSTFLRSRIVIFDVLRGTVIKTLPESSDSGQGCEMALGGCDFNSSLDFSPDGRFLSGTSYGLTDPGLDENAHPEEVTERRFWEVSSGKTLLRWDNTIPALPPFSPDGKAVLYQADKCSEGDDAGYVTEFYGVFEFRDVRTNRRATFQISRPGKREDGFHLMRLSGDGKVRVALDKEGSIWVQKLR